MRRGVETRRPTPAASRVLRRSSSTGADIMVSTTWRRSPLPHGPHGWLYPSSNRGEKDLDYVASTIGTLGVRDEVLRDLRGRASKRGGYRSQKLPGGDHSALGDALATLRLIEEI